jgi:hypothetical protein
MDILPVQPAQKPPPFHPGEKRQDFNKAAIETKPPEITASTPPPPSGPPYGPLDVIG